MNVKDNLKGSQLDSNSADNDLVLIYLMLVQ